MAPPAPAPPAAAAKPETPAPVAAASPAPAPVASAAPSAAPVAQAPTAAPTRAPILYFGMSTEPLNRVQQARLHTPDRQGALVVDTIAGGPGAEAGLQKDDVVRTVEGKPVTGSDGLSRAVAKTHQPGDRVTVGAWRAGKSIEVPLTLVDGIAFLTKTCDLGVARACAELAQYYLEGNGVMQDKWLTARLLERACQRGEGCATLGYLYEAGFGVGKDLGRAVALYKQACDGGRASSCFNLGIRYEAGRGVDKNEVKAAAFYKQACDGAALNACVRLGSYYEVGKGTLPKDEARAGSLYKQACEGGEPSGCSAMAAWLKTGGSEEPAAPSAP
jgi:hypothetical protein